MKNKKFELLAPAKNLECAVSAINYGADAVYIGANSFGARQYATNNLDDIKQLVDYAHKFYVKVFCTVNTILDDKELLKAKELIENLDKIGVDAIIIPNDRSVSVNATVVKTSAGAISHVKIIRVANLTATINKLKGIGYWIVGTDMKGTDYTKIDYNIPVCLVIGNEGSGMSKIVRDNCDYIATIPMEGKVNSLNASVSAGILIYRMDD